MLTREEILAGPKEMQRVKVDVPEWGGKVYVAELTGQQRDALDAAVDEHRDEDGKINSFATYRALVAMHTVVDSNGRRMFNADDLQDLIKQPSRPMERIRITADKLNGLTAEEIESIRKNCERPTATDCGSSLPSGGAAQ